jgi:hypothetical protein
MRITLSLAGLALFSGAATAETMNIEVEIPQLDVAEYHRPYLAAWIARPDHSVAANLAVWYQQERRGEDEGETWLKDLRQWWRRAGRSLEMPIDGVSGPTRAPGTQDISFETSSPVLEPLEPGEYILMVEAVREVGGRETVEIPFTWPLETPGGLSATGENELGKVTLSRIAD